MRYCKSRPLSWLWYIKNNKIFNKLGSGSSSADACSGKKSIVTATPPHITASLFFNFALYSNLPEIAVCTVGATISTEDTLETCSHDKFLGDQFFLECKNTCTGEET